jgi:hypothetical protein
MKKRKSNRKRMGELEQSFLRDSSAMLEERDVREKLLFIYDSRMVNLRRR